jgi:hypothetical protein
MELCDINARWMYCFRNTAAETLGAMLDFERIAANSVALDSPDNHLGIIAAHAVAGVDMELGGRPGWPVDRHADRLSICADLSEELEQRPSVNWLVGSPTLGAGAAGTERARPGGGLSPHPDKLGLSEDAHGADRAGALQLRKPDRADSSENR